MFENKGILLTFKLDDKQVKEVTTLIMDFIKKRFDNYDTDLDDMEKTIDKLNDKIERLSK